MSHDACVGLAVFGGLMAGFLIGALFAGDFSKTYAAGDIEGMRADYKARKNRWWKRAWRFVADNYHDSGYGQGYGSNL